MPTLTLLTPELLQLILDEAFALLRSPGVKVQNAEALDLLAQAGAEVDREAEVARLPEPVVRRALETVPHEFALYDRDGRPAVHVLQTAKVNVSHGCVMPPSSLAICSFHRLAPACCSAVCLMHVSASEALPFLVACMLRLH
jgi:trimethylamine--corrinoid protein Co-methyltransferase